MRFLVPAIAFATSLSAPAYAADGAAMLGGTTLSFLALGFAVGLAHALEADHVAAVATMMEKNDGRRGIILRGTAWGLGHTLALFVICSVVLMLGLTISSTVESVLELAVGFMIAGLGLRVLWKLRRERIHIHAHAHNGARHVHAHSHARDPDRHDEALHRHRHPARAMLPTLGIGLIHGAAGSAGLLVLVVATAPSTAQAMLAFVVFGIGSLIGMTLLTAAASYPLGRIHRGAAWMRMSLAFCIGGLACLVGGGVVVDSLGGLGVMGF
ncbi:MAG: ABC-type nickel/cobalt efflux system permease component RcnA [Yoonia sp.]|jgi:ABC-type nickel/cobalt efflux system permease component RcnA